MNKKQFNRITNLYRDGVSEQVCITSIIEMSKSDFEASTFISRFYNEMILASLCKENEALTLELNQWQKLEKRLKEIEDESSNREKSSNVEDQRPNEDKRVPRMS